MSKLFKLVNITKQVLVAVPLLLTYVAILYFSGLLTKIVIDSGLLDEPTNIVLKIEGEVNPEKSISDFVHRNNGVVYIDPKDLDEIRLLEEKLTKEYIAEFEREQVGMGIVEGLYILFFVMLVVFALAGRNNFRECKLKIIFLISFIFFDFLIAGLMMVTTMLAVTLVLVFIRYNHHFISIFIDKR